MFRPLSLSTVIPTVALVDQLVPVIMYCIVSRLILNKVRWNFCCWIDPLHPFLPVSFTVLKLGLRIVWTGSCIVFKGNHKKLAPINSVCRSGIVDALEHNNRQCNGMGQIYRKYGMHMTWKGKSQVPTNRIIKAVVVLEWNENRKWLEWLTSSKKATNLLMILF